MHKKIYYIKHTAPWVIAALIFVYLFHLYPIKNLLKSLSYVNLWSFVPFAIGYFFFIYLVDSWVMTKTISAFSKTVRFKDVFLARGVTYLIMILNYPASQVGFAYYFKRRYNIPIFEAMGVFFFIILIDLLWLVTLALLGSLFQNAIVGGVDIAYLVRIFASGIFLFTFIWLAFWRRWFGKIDFLEKARQRPAFRIFERAKVSDYLRVAIMRIPIHLTIIIFMYVVLKTFGVSIPFVKILCNVPLVFFIGTLPITPGGLGTTNAAMVELLHPYVSGPVFESGGITPQELIFAASLLWIFANYLLKAITGTITMKKVSKDLFEAPSEENEEKLEKKAPPST